MQKRQSIDGCNNLKNIITDQEMAPRELEYSWQEFVGNRQATNNESFDNIEALLEDICDKKLIEDIRDAIIDRECKVTYIQYNKGFLDGIKLSVTLDKI